MTILLFHLWLCKVDVHFVKVDLERDADQPGSNWMIFYTWICIFLRTFLTFCGFQNLQTFSKFWSHSSDAADSVCWVCVCVYFHRCVWLLRAAWITIFCSDNHQNFKDEVIWMFLDGFVFVAAPMDAQMCVNWWGYQVYVSQTIRELYENVLKHIFNLIFLVFLETKKSWN